MASGRIDPGHASDVLLDLHRERETGLLEIYGKSRVYRIALRRGVPIHAQPGRVRWLLGDVIDHLDAPVETDIDTLRRVIATSHGRAGAMLTMRGLVSQEVVDRALKEQIRLRAQESLILDHGRYRFWPGPSALEGIPRQPDRWSAPDLVAAVHTPNGPHEGLLHLLRRLEKSTDPYEALGLGPGADPDQARIAYRMLARSHHPDHVGPQADPRTRLVHRRIFEAATRAYRQARAA